MKYRKLGHLPNGEIAAREWDLPFTIWYPLLIEDVAFPLGLGLFVGSLIGLWAFPIVWRHIKPSDAVSMYFLIGGVVLILIGKLKPVHRRFGI